MQQPNRSGSRSDEVASKFIRAGKCVFGQVNIRDSNEDAVVVVVVNKELAQLA